MYWVYILYSPKIDQYYIGQTSDLPNRLASHRQGNSFYTSRANDWVLVFAQETNLREEALALERKIKSKKSRKSILRYIGDARNKAVLFAENGA